MGRLFLTAADTDAAYLEGLLKHFSSAYSDRFRVSSFTSRDSLMKFLLGYEGTIDILLISLQLYSDLIPEDKINTLIILSAGRMHEDIRSHGVINKYQHGDRLVAEIINIYSQVNKSEIVSTSGDKKTRVVAVYSPAGGAGKTTITLSTCIKCAQRGLKVFYLNLENISTMPVFFKYRQSPNLSNIIYHLKENEKSLGLKIEGIRCIDPEYGLHFFAPPDSAFELEELLPEDINNLVMQMRNMHCYDLIFIDMSSCFNRCTTSLISTCDELFLVAEQKEASRIKLKSFECELDTLGRDMKYRICEKTVLIINQGIMDADQDMNGMAFCGKAAEIMLPVVKGCITADWLKRGLAEDSCFNSGISHLADRF